MWAATYLLTLVCCYCYAQVGLSGSGFYFFNELCRLFDAAQTTNVSAIRVVSQFDAGKQEELGEGQAAREETDQVLFAWYPRQTQQGVHLSRKKY